MVTKVAVCFVTLNSNMSNLVPCASSMSLWTLVVFNLQQLHIQNDNVSQVQLASMLAFIETLHEFKVSSVPDNSQWLFV